MLQVMRESSPARAPLPNKARGSYAQREQQLHRRDHFRRRHRQRRHAEQRPEQQSDWCRIERLGQSRLCGGRPPIYRATTTLDRGFTLGTGGGTIDIPTAATILTDSGAIAGSTSLTKIGAGTLTLTGTNTYTGLLNLNVGTVSVAGQANLGSTTTSGLTINFNGGALQITGPPTTPVPLYRSFR